jgi:hypothetical protein
MYSYSSASFEARIFNGKDDPQKQCLLFRHFFLPLLLTKEDARWHGCDLADNIPIRFPSLAGEELNGFIDSGGKPKVAIETQQPVGNKMYAIATSKFGRTVFFLIKMEEGWRVENALYYEDWPLAADAKCMSKFLVKPDDWHRKVEQPVCRQ